MLRHLTLEYVQTNESLVPTPTLNLTSNTERKLRNRGRGERWLNEEDGGLKTYRRWWVGRIGVVKDL